MSAAPEVHVAPGTLRRRLESVLEGLYDGGELVWVCAGKRRFLLVNSPDYIGEVLVQQADKLLKPVSQAIEIGRPTPARVSDPGAVERFRRALVRGLGPERIPDVLGSLAVAAAAERSGWRVGMRMRLMPRIRRLIIKSTTLGSFASRLPEEDTARLEAVMRWLNQRPRVRPVGLNFGKGIITETSRRLMLQRLDSVAQSLIENADPSTPAQLTAVLSGLPEIAPTMDATRQRRLIGELLLGAVGPLVQTAGWLLFQFATEREPARVVRAEWDEGLAPDEEVGSASLRRLRYTAAFVREVTRLHPTNPLIMRSAVVSTAVGDEEVPAHTQVVVNVGGAHRDESLFPEANRFVPERWLVRRPEMPKFAYASFGVGKRRCLGETSSMAVLVALLPGLMHRWTMRFGRVQSTRGGRRQLADGVRVTLSSV